jgi:O-antigen/teichoic acid export membrane protein
MEAMAVVFAIPAAILLNRFLGAEARGLLAAMMLMPSVVGTIVSCQWERTLKAIIAQKKESPQDVWARTRKYCWFLSIVGVFLVIPAIVSQFQLPFSLKLLAFVFACFHIPCFLVILFVSNFFAAHGQLYISYFVRLIGPFAYLASIVMGAVFWNINLTYALFANLMNVVVGTVCALFFTRKLDFAKKSFKLFDSALSNLVKPLPPFALEVVSLQAGIWFFSTFVGNVATGSYVAFRFFIFPMRVSSLGLVNVGVSRVNWTDWREAMTFVLKASCLLIFLGAGALLGVVFLGKSIVIFVLGNSFIEDLWMLPIVVLAESLESLGFFLLSSLQLLGGQKEYLIIQYWTATSKITLIAVGCYFFGGKGIILGLCLSAILRIVSTSVMLLIRRKYEYLASA